MSLHPTQYAQVLRKRMLAANSQAYLVNTGWNGSGKRISIRDTRAIIDAILDDSIEHHATSNLPIFNLAIPNVIKNVDPQVLDPRLTYANPEAWDVKAKNLAEQFIGNFVKFTDVKNGEVLVSAGPQL